MLQLVNLPQVFGDFHQHVKLTINLNSNTSDIDVSVDKTGLWVNLSPFLQIHQITIQIQI